MLCIESDYDGIQAGDNVDKDYLSGWYGSWHVKNEKGWPFEGPFEDPRVFEAEKTASQRLWDGKKPNVYVFKEGKCQS